VSPSAETAAAGSSATATVDARSVDATTAPPPAPRGTTLSDISVALAYAGWALASLFFFYSFATRVSPSIMVDALMRDFGLGAAILGNLSAIYFYVYGALQIPIGIALDRFGPRRLLGGGALIAALGCAVFALADAAWLAYLGRFLIGAGVASGWLGTLAVIVQNFPARRFALLAGGTQAFGMAGATMGQVPLSLVVETQGWRAAMGSLALFGVLLALALILVLRDRIVPQARAIAIGAAVRHAIRSRQTWLCAIFSMAMIAPMLGFAGLWGVPYLMQVHALSRTEAAGLASAMFIAWGVASPLVGAISDRIGSRRRVMIAGAALATLLLASLPFMAAAPLWLLAALILGIGTFGSSYVAGLSLARESNPDAISGTVLGLVNTCVIATGAILQPAIGWILDLHWDGAMAAGARIYPPDAFAWGLAVLPVVAALGALAAFFAKDARAD